MSEYTLCTYNLPQLQHTKFKASKAFAGDLSSFGLQGN